MRVFLDCLLKPVFVFINVDWSAPDTENKIWCNVTSVQPLPNTKPFIFFFITSLPSVFVPVFSLELSPVSRTTVISGITLGSIARLLPRYINPPAAGTKTAAGGFTPAVNDSSFLYHDSSLLCHVWTQIHLSCCIYVRSNRDHSHNNTCIITKGTLRSSNAIKMMNETLANTFPGVWTLTNLNDA